MVEKYGILVLALGAVLALSAFLWLVARAFRAHLAWGLGCLLFPPVAVLFSVLHFRRVMGPLLLLLAAALLMGGTFGLSSFLAHYASLGPREKLVDGELHMTLTGWGRTDYSLLWAKPDTVVLQMANPDVTFAEAAAQQGRGSSLWHRTKRCQAVMLADGPLRLGQSWLAHVHQMETEAELKALRRSTQRGTPFGETIWQQAAAKRLGLESTLRPPGRPQRDSQRQPKRTRK